MAELAVAHDLRRERGVAPQLAAELADDARLALIEVDALTDERCAATVLTVVAVGGQRADTAAQQMALELLDVGDLRGHGA